MTFLPIVERELRVAARRRQTYWTRFFAVLGTLTLSCWIWIWIVDGQPAAERGQTLFRVIAWLAFTYSLLAGISITADALSEERREGTLGLLFLTDLNGYDVVLGKLAATSLNAFYRLISVFPILAIPLILGGLTVGEFWRMTLVLVNTLFFSLSAGMVASAFSLRERRAMTATFLLIGVVTVGPPLLGLVVAAHDRTVPYNQTWLLSSAVYPCVLSFDASYRLSPRSFWSSIAVTHVIGWGLLAIASGRVRHAWQDQPAVGRAGRWREGWQAWQFGHGPARSLARTRLLNLNPIAWQIGRDRVRSISVLSLLLGLGVMWLGLYWKYRSALLEPTFYFLTAYCAHTCLKLWLASEACRPLAEDRRIGALELVLSTPLSVDDILDGELLALKRQFAWPVGIVLCADFAMLLGGMSDGRWDSSNDWVVLCLALMILFIVDLYTLAWVGLWLSLNAKKASRAVRGTVGRVLVLPWAVFMLGLTMLTLTPWQNFELGELGVLVAAFALGLLNDAFFLTWSRTNLRERFRGAATERFQSRELSESGTVQAGACQGALPLN